MLGTFIPHPRTSLPRQPAGETAQLRTVGIREFIPSDRYLLSCDISAGQHDLDFLETYIRDPDTAFLALFHMHLLNRLLNRYSVRVFPTAQKPAVTSTDCMSVLAKMPRCDRNVLTIASASSCTGLCNQLATNMFRLKPRITRINIHTYSTRYPPASMRIYKHTPSHINIRAIAVLNIALRLAFATTSGTRLILSVTSLTFQRKLLCIDSRTLVPHSFLLTLGVE